MRRTLTSTDFKIWGNRKGVDNKSISVVMAIVLVLMFVALFFGGISEWLGSAADQLMATSDQWRDVGD